MANNDNDYSVNNEGENFDLTMDMEKPVNSFKIVHLNNKSNVYHLTRQVLLDAALTQDTYCFFYHILAKDSDEFNETYGSFACLFARNEHEADLYLNVDSDALEHIVKYVQTGKINGEELYSENWKLIDEIIDLATMFGMPNLVSMLRNLHPSEDYINSKINYYKYLGKTLINMYKLLIDPEEKWYDNTIYDASLDSFINDNRQKIVDTIIKNNMYSNSFNMELLKFYATVFINPFLEYVMKRKMPTTEN